MICNQDNPSEHLLRVFASTSPEPWPSNFLVRGAAAQPLVNLRRPRGKVGPAALATRPHSWDQRSCREDASRNCPIFAIEDVFLRQACTHLYLDYIPKVIAVETREVQFLEVAFLGIGGT